MNTHLDQAFPCRYASASVKNLLAYAGPSAMTDNLDTHNLVDTRRRRRADGEFSTPQVELANIHNQLSFAKIVQLRPIVDVDEILFSVLRLEARGTLPKVPCLRRRASRELFF